MNTKRDLRKDERAVTPVIGVILMVAVTVIMAAIIAAFVYGYSGSMTQTKDVAATARHQNDTIYATYMGGPDDGLIKDFSARMDCVAPGVFTQFTAFTVGSEATCVGAAAGQDNHVVVVANFTDGTSQVILDTFC